MTPDGSSFSAHIGASDCQTLNLILIPLLNAELDPSIWWLHAEAGPYILWLNAKGNPYIRWQNTQTDSYI